MSGSVPPLSMRRHDSFLNTNENIGKRKFNVTQPVKYVECLTQARFLLVYQQDGEFIE